MTPLPADLAASLGAFGLKSLALFGLAGVALLALRRASAASRHLVCLLTLLALLLLPALSASLPGWAVPALSLPATRPVVPVALPAPPAADTSAPLASVPVPVPSAALPPTAPVAPPTPPRPFPWTTVLLACWLVGVSAAFLRPLLGLWGIGRLRRDCRPVTDALILALAQDCASALRLKRLPALWQADVPVPMTWGWRRPVVLLPLAAQTWPADRLQAVLLHEQAHVRRGDWLSHRLADFTCALYWFHPFAWLTARRLRAEGEMACDDLVLSSGVAAPDYARHLLDVARGLQAAPILPQAALAMAHSLKIERRLKTILDTTHPRRALTRRVLLLALVPSLMAVGIVAMLRPASPDGFGAVTAGRGGLPVTLPNGVVVRLAGVTDTQSQAAWWSADGSRATQPLPKNTLTYPNLSGRSQGRAFAVAAVYTLASQPHDTWANAPRFGWAYQQVQPGVYARRPDYTWRITPDDHRRALDHFQPEKPQGRARVTDVTLIPHALSAQERVCQIRWGVAAGPWTEVVDCPKTEGKVYRNTPSGQVIFTLVSNPHHLPAAQAALGNARFMASDYFRAPLLSPDENPSHTDYAASANLERTVFGLDGQGRIVYELRDGCLTTPDPAGRLRAMQEATIPSSLLKRVVTFRLVARPYQWVEFPNVALQPAPPLHPEGKP